MKIGLYGFEARFDVPRTIASTTFQQQLVKPGGVTIQTRAIPADQPEGHRLPSEYWPRQLIAIRHKEKIANADRDLIIGVIIRDRDHRSMAIKQRDRTKFTISKEELEANKSFVDFGFFVFACATGRGVLQTYFQGLQLPQFLKDLATISRLANTQGVAEQEDSEEERKKVPLPPDLLPICRKGTFDERLQELTELKEVVFQYAEYSDNVSELSAIEGTIKRSQRSVAFKKGYLDVVRAAILKMAANKKRPLKSIGVHGVAEDGIEKLVKFAQTPDKLREGDFDDWLTNVSLDSSDWDKSLRDCLAVKKLFSVLGEAGIKKLIFAEESK